MNTATGNPEPVGRKEWRLKALTDIWTGDAEGKPCRLITTGLLGSIRWWFEVLVRGLNGGACDPTDTKCEGRNHCVVCELFGCTGWARKFRFDVLDVDGMVQQSQIKAGSTLQLRLTPLRPICDEEWTLLDATIRLIADYAAIGGKTVYKPSEENHRQNAAHHRDYGIVSIEQPADVDGVSLERLQTYVRYQRWRQVKHGDYAWASLESFWSLSGRHLARQDANRSAFNRVIGRPEPKGQAKQGDSWLAGRRASGGQQPESKKVFSVKDPPRTFGFTNGNQFSLDETKTKLRSVWHDLDDADVRTGNAILEMLLGEATP